jgi:hypothetical protein
MVGRLKVGAVAHGDMVVVDVGTAENEDKIPNMVRLKIGREIQ